MFSDATPQDVCAKAIDQILRSSRLRGWPQSAKDEERLRLESLDGRALAEEWKSAFPNAADTGRRLTDFRQQPTEMMILLLAYDVRLAENEPTA
jgi:hypothetical protein